MTINLKTTILFSVAVAAALNAGQFFASYQQREAAFAPTWAQAASAPPTSTPAEAVKLATSHQPATQPTVVVAPATSAPSPAPNPTATAIAARLASTGLNPTYAALYLSVEQQTGTPWQLLAAVHHVETGQAGSTSRTSYAGAVGPMQFLPATFAHYAADGNGDGVADITNLDDAMLTAGRYLAASGAASGNWSAALYRYNHSDSYVSRVLAIAYQLGI